jgi:GDP-L-fucose synthase
LTDVSQARALFDRLRPKRALHLAARVGGVKSNAAKNADLFALNSQINANVLSVANQYGVQRLVSVLSSCAFALYPERPSNEDDLHVGMPFEGNLGYGCSKRMLDVHTRLLWEQYGCQFSTVAPVTMFGPHDNFDLEDGHVIGALIHKMTIAKETDSPVEVWGSGNAVRQFVYAKDVARVLLAELDSFEGPETTIVAPDEGLPIRTLVEQIARAVRFEGPVKFDRTKPEGVAIKRVVSKRFESRYPGFAFTPMEAGLAETVDWFCRHRLVAFPQTSSA